MLQLSQKSFKAAIINIFQVIKENRPIRSEKIESISREIKKWPNRNSRTKIFNITNFKNL